MISTGSLPMACPCAPPPPTSSIGAANFQQHVLDPIVSAVRYLASRHVDYIIHTGMPVVTTRGKGSEDVLVKQIEDETGLLPPPASAPRSALLPISACATSQW